MLPPLLRHPLPWTLASLLWAAVLWALSSGPVTAPPGPELPHFDKVLHFGYFFGGGGLVAAALFFRWAPRRVVLVATATCLCAAVGALDEWHQSWVPERTGNDPYDWTADILGALAGSLVFHALLPRLVPPSPQPAPASP